MLISTISRLSIRSEKVPLTFRKVAPFVGGVVSNRQLEFVVVSRQIPSVRLRSCLLIVIIGVGNKISSSIYTLTLSVICVPSIDCSSFGGIVSNGNSEVSDYHHNQ